MSSYSSDSSFSSDSLIGGPEARERCSGPILKWLTSPRPPHTCNIGVQTDREVVPELQEAGAQAKHCWAQWRCYQGLPCCHFGAFRCFSYMAQEGGESNFSDSDVDGLGKIPIETPSWRCDWLFEYLPEEDAGKSVSGL